MSDSVATRWENVTSTSPCEVCGSDSWCSRSVDGTAINCRRKSYSEKYGAGRQHIATDGHEFWTYQTEATADSWRLDSPSRPPSSHKADLATLNAVYSKLVHCLPWSNAAATELSRRSLSSAEIVKLQMAGYKWLPAQGRSRIARRILQDCGEEAVSQSPGLILREFDGKQYWTIAGREGLVIPVRDIHGRIVAIMVRAAIESGNGRYRYLSSKKFGGSGPGSPIHVPLSTLKRDTVRLTEGVLKSDIATLKSGMLTVGLPGVGSWRRAATILAELGAKTVHVAFDADWRTNVNVGKALRNVVEHLHSHGFQVVLEVWASIDGKGIDDVLIANRSIQLLSSIEEIREVLNSVPLSSEPGEERNDRSSNLPAVTLPGKNVRISETASELGSLLGKTGAWFRRGNAVHNLVSDDDGKPALRQCKAATLASAFESVAEIKILREGETGPVAVPAVCSESTAKLIAHSEGFLGALPPIRILAQSPVLVESEGELVEVIGYHKPSGVMAFGEPTENVTFDEAVTMLKGLVRDFKFASESDESRAIAAFITPALVQGGLLRGRSPIDLGEANESQTGKGFRNKLTAAIYNQQVRTVTQRSGGVGSLEESLNTALVAGANFICLDNVRGKIDSPAIESLLTEDLYYARVPHAAAVEVDPRRVIIMMTSNKAQVTDDLANRSSCVRLLKQDERYQFQHFPEGDILEHVRANQPKYLGAVFAIIREWHRQGKPRSTETRHDFRPWAQTLDWIVQNIMGCSPLLDGHQAAQERMTNPTLSWLRDVGLRVCQSGHEGQWIRTNKILDILIDAGDVEIPGVKRDQDIEDESVRSTAIRQIGIKLGRCFKKDQFIDIDNIQIDRIETEDDQYRKRYDYKFSVTPAVPRNGPAVTPAVNPDTPAIPAVNHIINVRNSEPTNTHFLIESNANTAGLKGCNEVNSFTRGVNGLKTIENAVCPICGFDSDQPGKECAACRKSN